MTKKDLKAVIVNAILSNDKAAVRALMLVFEQQTLMEKNAESTYMLNGVGFSSADAEILTSFAKQVQRWNSAGAGRHDSPLSPKQMAIVKRRMVHYWRQLIPHAEAAARRNDNPVMGNQRSAL